MSPDSINVPVSNSTAMPKSSQNAVLARAVLLLATAAPLLTTSYCCLKPLFLVLLLCRGALCYHPTEPN